MDPLAAWTAGVLAGASVGFFYGRRLRCNRDFFSYWWPRSPYLIGKIRGEPRFEKMTVDQWAKVYGTPVDNQKDQSDWRRSFNHENTNRPSGQPPLKLLRSKPTRELLFFGEPVRAADEPVKPQFPPPQKDP